MGLPCRCTPQRGDKVFPSPYTAKGYRVRFGLPCSLPCRCTPQRVGQRRLAVTLYRKGCTLSAWGCRRRRVPRLSPCTAKGLRVAAACLAVTLYRKGGDKTKVGCARRRSPCLYRYRSFTKSNGIVSIRSSSREEDRRNLPLLFNPFRASKQVFPYS